MDQVDDASDCFIHYYRKENTCDTKLAYINEEGRNCNNAYGSKHLGGKDHATVLYACKTIGDLMTTDRSFKQYISDIEKIIYSNI